MSVRRTKQSKETAQLRRVEKMTYSFTADTTTLSSNPTLKSSSKKKQTDDSTDLLHFDTNLIKKDLLRTILASVVVFGIIGALYLKF